MKFHRFLRLSVGSLSFALLNSIASAECTCRYDFQFDDDAAAKKAVSECSVVLKENPKKKEIYAAALCRGHAQSRLKQYDKAFADFDAAQAIDAEAWDPTLAKAKTYEKIKKKKNAIEAYRDVLEINPYIIDAKDALRRLGADKGGANEAWRSSMMPSADGRKISYPETWIFQQFDKTKYLVHAPWDADPNMSCVLIVQDLLKEEHANKDAAHWAKIFDTAYLESWCNSNTPGGKYKNMKLTNSQLVETNKVPTLQCDYTYGSTDEKDNKPRFNYMIKWFTALDKVPLLVVCTAELKSRNKLKSETPVFVKSFTRLRNSIVR